MQTVSEMTDSVPGSVFVSPNVIRHARDAFPDTEDILAFKLPARDTDNETISEGSAPGSVNFLP
jgi:hypothetical protein